MANIIRTLKRNFLWIIFAIFAIAGILTKQDTSIFISEGPYSLGKYIIWLIFFSFFGFTVYCSNNENFFKSIKRMFQMLWGRQVGIDLYIGLLFPLLIIYLNGGTFIFLLWLIPVLFNGNLFTLLYFALNYDTLVQQFMV